MVLEVIARIRAFCLRLACRAQTLENDTDPVTPRAGGMSLATRSRLTIFQHLRGNAAMPHGVGTSPRGDVAALRSGWIRLGRGPHFLEPL